jgi:hypothetical protein
MVFVLGTVNFVTGRQQIVRELPLPDQAGYNLASCLKKNTPTPEVVEDSFIYKKGAP